MRSLLGAEGQRVVGKEERMSEAPYDLWSEFGRRAPETASYLHPSMVYSLREQEESWRKRLLEMEYIIEFLAGQIEEYKRRLDDIEDDVRESGKCSLFVMGRLMGDSRMFLEEWSAANDLLLGYVQKVEREIRDAV